MNYRIQIDEKARVELLEAIRLANQLNQSAERDFIASLLNILPSWEERWPGIVHKFDL